MTWDPLFDWGDMTSFYGKTTFPVMESFTSELNPKCVAVSISEIDSPVRGNPIGMTPIAVDSKMVEVIPEYYNHFIRDGSKFTLAQIETEIGQSQVKVVNGGLLNTPWIDWNYQAIELLLPQEIYASEWWNGLGANSPSSGDPTSDQFFIDRWALSGYLTAAVGGWIPNALKVNVTSIDTPAILNHKTNGTFSGSIEFYLDYRGTNITIDCGALVFTLQSKFPDREDVLISSPTVDTVSTSSGGTWFPGTWKITSDGVDISLYYNGGLIYTSPSASLLRSPDFSIAFVSMFSIFGFFASISKIRILDTTGDDILL